MFWALRSTKIIFTHSSSVYKLLRKSYVFVNEGQHLVKLRGVSDGVPTRVQEALTHIEVALLELLFVLVHEHVQQLGGQVAHGVFVELARIVKQDHGQGELVVVLQEVVEGLGLVASEAAPESQFRVHVGLRLLSELGLELLHHHVGHLQQREEVGSDLDGVLPVELHVGLVSELGQLPVVGVVLVENQLA